MDHHSCATGNFSARYGWLSDLFDACRTCRVIAFARDLDLAGSGILARLTAVFFARSHRAGAGNVCAFVLLCHMTLLRSTRMVGIILLRWSAARRSISPKS